MPRALVVNNNDCGYTFDAVESTTLGHLINNLNRTDLPADHIFTTLEERCNVNQAQIGSLERERSALTAEVRTLTQRVNNLERQLEQALEQLSAVIGTRTPPSNFVVVAPPEQAVPPAPRRRRATNPNTGAAPMPPLRADGVQAETAAPVQVQPVSVAPGTVTAPTAVLSTGSATAQPVVGARNAAHPPAVVAAAGPTVATAAPVTLDTVRGALQRYSQVHGVENARQLLSRTASVNAVSQIPENLRGAVVAAINAASTLPAAATVSA